MLTDTKPSEGWAHGSPSPVVGLTLRGETSLRRATRAVTNANVAPGKVVMACGPSITTEGDGYEPGFLKGFVNERG